MITLNYVHLHYDPDRQSGNPDSRGALVFSRAAGQGAALAENTGHGAPERKRCRGIGARGVFVSGLAGSAYVKHRSRVVARAEPRAAPNQVGLSRR